MVPRSSVSSHRLSGPELEEDLERRILERTWGRIHQLHIERKGEQVIVQGYCPSYYVKQLVLLAVQESAQPVPVKLEIQVEDAMARRSEGHHTV